MKKLIATITMFCSTLSLSAQQYGNEWIDHNQEYYTFKIDTDGFYKIDYQTLENSGVDVSNIDPKTIKIFQRGEESWIYVFGEEDGSFDTTDYILVRGLRNDGYLDSSLYGSSNNLFNPYYSLYEDSSTVYVTWGLGSSSKHLEMFDDKNYLGLTADSVILYKSVVYFGDQLSDGIPFNNDPQQVFSEYTNGEGYASHQSNRYKEFQLSTPFAYINGHNAELRTQIISRNNPIEIHLGYNHELGISYGSSSNVLYQNLFNAYKHFDFDKNPIEVTPSSITNKSSVYIGEVDRTNRPNSLFAVSYISLKYERTNHLAGNSEFQFKSLSNNSFFEFNGYPSLKTNPFVINLSDGYITTAKKVSNKIQFKIPSSQNADMFIFDLSDVKSVEQIFPHEFSIISSKPFDYLIITNSKLENSAQIYKQYRESTIGGKHKVLTLFCEDLYHHFSYGVHHPIAIRRAIEFLSESSTLKIKNILLLGKGQTYNEIRTNASKRFNLDLVPTIGLPPSDYLFVSKLDGNDLSINIPIGRVAARTDEDVLAYLDKVKAHESNDYGEWKKKIIQIAGGKTNSESQAYINHLTNFYKIASDSFLGASRTLFSKDESSATTSSLVPLIQSSIDSGCALLNYFGHGSASVLEVDIGEPSDLNNYGRYPFFAFYGCALGNCYVQNSLGENYMFEPRNGAIMWLAGTNFGFPSSLTEYGKTFYQNLLQRHYDSSVGYSIMQTIKQYQNGLFGLNRINSRQLMYQGDPALKLRVANKPDVVIANAAILNDFSSIEDIRLSFDIKNIGRTVKDSVTIQINAQKSGQIIKAFERNFRIPNYKSTHTITIKKTDFYSGNMTFRLIADKDDTLDELNNDNNTYLLNHIFELQKPLIISPFENEIVSRNSVDILFQVANRERKDIEIFIELDTTPEFSSPIIESQTVTSNKNLNTTNLRLPPFNGSDYFIRIRTKIDTIYSDWSFRSFAYLYNHEPGWSAKHRSNYSESTLEFLNWRDSTSKNLVFGNRTSTGYRIMTNGRFPSSGFDWNFFSIQGEINMIRNYKPNGVQLAILNPNSEKRISYPSQFNMTYPYATYWQANPVDNQKEYYIPGDYTGVWLFDTRLKEHRDSLIELLENTPDGYHLIMHNNRITGIEQWEDTVFKTIEQFGLNGLRSIKEGEPFALLGTKGGGLVKVQFGDYSDTINPPINQNYEMGFNLLPKVSVGSLKSSKIGPSGGWNKAKVSFKSFDSVSDSFTITIIGVALDGTEQRLLTSDDSIIDISSISHRTYPYLKLEVTLFDDVQYTPIGVDRWIVSYDPVPEGLITFDNRDFNSGDTIEQGETLRFETAFTNVSNVVYDSTQVSIYLINELNLLQSIDTIWLPTINPGDTYIFGDTIQSYNLVGNFRLIADVNFNRTTLEIEYTNNTYYTDFHVVSDSKNPLIDVKFDGYSILNNDIVSSNTLVSITGTDDNKYLFLNDPNLFEIKVLYPDDSLRKWSQNDPNYTFIPATTSNTTATINYQTTDLADGTYQLEAKLTDRNGNGEDLEPYTIKFKVINEQAITNLFPYPNPFTTCTRFVFTCTGSDVPDQIGIEIYSISGRLVKSISKEDLGPIRIGNNKTEYCWDGTDQYGDKLANGVYLYKVTTKSNGIDLKRRETSGDMYFNQGFGKLYIAR